MTRGANCSSRRNFWNPWAQAARWSLEKKDYETGMSLIDKSIQIKETWMNDFVKAQLLAARGNYKEALPLAQKAKEMGDKEGDGFFLKDEVESALRDHPAVADVCVVGRPDRDLGERVIAFVVPLTGQAPALDDLRQFLAERGLARYKWPEFVELLPEIPLSGPGKVDRRALKDRAAQAAQLQ